MTLLAPTSLFPHKRNPLHYYQKKVLGRRYPIAATKGKQADKLGETIDDLGRTASSSSDDDIHSLPPDEEQEAARLEWRAYHLQSGDIDEALGLSVTGEEEEEVKEAVAKLEAARLEWRAHHLETGAYGEALDLSLSAEEREEVERSMPPQSSSSFHDYLPDKTAYLDRGWRMDAGSPTKAEEDLAAIGAKIERSDDLYMKNEFVKLLYPDRPTSGPLQLLELKVDRSKQWLPSPQLLFMQAVVGLGRCANVDTTFEFAEGRVREKNILNRCVPKAMPEALDHVVGGFVSPSQAVDVAASNGFPCGFFTGRWPLPCLPPTGQYGSLTIESCEDGKLSLAGYTKARGHYIAVLDISGLEGNRQRHTEW